MSKLIASYNNGNDVSIYDDGTKTREGNNTASFPESIDVKITDWCDAACLYCHERSTIRGKHGDLSFLLNVTKNLPAGVEFAIGGGHPLSHPEFDELVQVLTETRGIICNVTINEKHFEQERAHLEKLIDKGFIKGVGYSYSTKPLEWDYPHACTHVIIGVSYYNELESIIEKNSGKVLLLGYKNYGRGIKYINVHDNDVNKKRLSWYRNLFSAVRIAHISFDNLGIQQLKPERLFLNDPHAYEEFFMGDDGKYTMYLDVVSKQYARSSTNERFSMCDDSHIEAVFNSF